MNKITASISCNSNSPLYSLQIYFVLFFKMLFVAKNIIFNHPQAEICKHLLEGLLSGSGILTRLHITASASLVMLSSQPVVSSPSCFSVWSWLLPPGLTKSFSLWIFPARSQIPLLNLFLVLFFSWMVTSVKELVGIYLPTSVSRTVLGSMEESKRHMWSARRREQGTGERSLSGVGAVWVAGDVLEEWGGQRTLFSLPNSEKCRQGKES